MWRSLAGTPCGPNAPMAVLSRQVCAIEGLHWDRGERRPPCEHSGHVLDGEYPHRVAGSFARTSDVWCENQVWGR